MNIYIYVDYLHIFMYLCNRVCIYLCVYLWYLCVCICGCLRLLAAAAATPAIAAASSYSHSGGAEAWKWMRGLQRWIRISAMWHLGSSLVDINLYTYLIYVFIYLSLKRYVCIYIQLTNAPPNNGADGSAFAHMPASASQCPSTIHPGCTNPGRCCSPLWDHPL